MNNTTKKHIKNLSIAATSSLPIIGGPISIIMDKYLPEFVEERREKLWEEINKQLLSLEKAGTQLDLNSQMFLSVFMKCFKLAIEEHEVEKITAFRNIIVNSALPRSNEFDETTLFMNWVREFTVDQIRVLKAIKHNEEIAYNSNSSELYYILKQHFPYVPKDYLIMCAQELVGKNIIVYGNGHRVRELKNPDQKVWFLSDMGDRFISFIESPKMV